jgi:tyrosyl-tRNA synthetase
MGVLEFLRDVGKHFTVNRMLGKDSVRTRLEREDGISYTEFSYMLLQANDYLVLNQTEGCELQVAGSDQWGNITAGIDLIRRSAGRAVHGLTSPLLMRSDGQKFGKSEGDALWLDGGLTSPYQLFQYFMQVDDADIETMLLRLTFVPVEAIASLMVQHGSAPGRRDGQRALARAVTEIVHGSQVLGPVEAATAILFGADPQGADEETFGLLAGELATTDVTPTDLDDLPALFVRTGLATSKGEIRKNPRGYYANGRSIDDQRSIDRSDLLHDRYLLLRRGKTAHHLVRISG